MKSANRIAALPVPAITGCTALGPAGTGFASPHYRCEHQIAFSVRFEGDVARLDGGAGEAKD